MDFLKILRFIEEQELLVFTSSELAARLEELFESASLNYHSLDMNGRIIQVNSAWLKTLGYSKKEVIGRWFGEFLESDSALLFSERYVYFIQSRENSSLELTICASDGSTLLCEFSCLGVFSGARDLSHTHCVFQNITRQRKAEKALEDSEIRLSRITDATQLGIFEYDATQKKLTYVNDVIRNVLGESVENKDIPELFNLLADEFKHIAQNRIERIIAGKNPERNFEYKLVTGEGTSIWVEVISRFVREDGRVKIIGIAKDITERKRLQAELEKSNLRFDEITRNFPSIIFHFSKKEKNLQFHYLSENIENFCGYSDIQIKDNANIIHKLIDPREFSRISKYGREAAEKGSPVQLTFKIRHKDGSNRWSNTVVSAKPVGEDEILFTGVCNDITEEKRLREELTRNELLFKAIVNSSASGMSTMSKNGMVTHVNKRLCELSGYSEEDLIGKHFLQIPAFYAKDAARYIRLYQDALLERYPEEPVPFEWKHKSGERRHGEALLSSIKKDGKIIGYQAVLIETTQRVLIQQAEDKRVWETNRLFEWAVKLLSIENENELYESLANELQELEPGAIIITNSVNPEKTRLVVEAFRMRGKSGRAGVMKLLGNKVVSREFPIDENTFKYATAGRLDIYHSSIYELALQQIPKKVCDQLEKFIKLGSIHEISLGTPEEILGGAVLFLKKGFEIEHKNLIETMVKEASGALLRMRANRKLDESEKLYKSLAESSGEWIIRFNQSLQHIYINPVVSSDLQRDPASILGKTCGELGYSSEHTKLIENHISEVIARNQPSNCDLEIQIANKTKYFEWSFYPENITPNEKSVLVFARNITHRKEMEGELLDMISTKRRLYSIISHDLRSPFNTIVGFMNLLAERYDNLSDEERLQYIHLVGKTSMESLALFESVLEWIIDSEKGEKITPVYFNLSGTVAKAISLLQAPILEKNIRIVNRMPEQNLVFADHNMIFTVVRNIISNALKFSPENGEVIISQKESEHDLCCIIEDRGSGMSGEYLEMFRRKDKLPVGRSILGVKGFGLGLQLSREFVEKNRGKIEIESEEGKGTRVTFSMPKNSE